MIDESMIKQEKNLQEAQINLQTEGEQDRLLFKLK
ncbi:hypothetical protein G8J22_00400 [Lentilactobacillus hilgardii]|nr:hypothetical protein G8J22_00400 [Lentilactobacillus hilgardii]